MTLFTPLTLPNGTVIPNRIAKVIALYRRRADGGSDSDCYCEKATDINLKDRLNIVEPCFAYGF